MKKQLFALVGLGLLLATASATAQTVPLKTNIPFNFIVNKTELPAGEYTLQSLGATGKVMLIQSTDRLIAKMVVPIACASQHRQREANWFSIAMATGTSSPDLDGGYDQGRELPKSTARLKSHRTTLFRMWSWPRLFAKNIA